MQSKWTQGPHILAKLKFTKKEELFTDMVQKCEFRLAAETRSIATTAIGQLIWEHTVMSQFLETNVTKNMQQL